MLKECPVAGWILGVKHKICFFRVSMIVFHRLKVLQILSGQKWEIVPTLIQGQLFIHQSEMQFGKARNP